MTMSFLSELQHRKSELSHTTTRVTTPGGNVFCEERVENGYSSCQLREREPGSIGGLRFLVLATLKPSVLPAPQFDAKRKIMLGRDNNLKIAKKFVVDTKPDLGVAKVLPGLLMGSQDVAADFNVLKENFVTHVLNVGHDSTVQFPGISYTQVQLLDLPEIDLLRSLPQCLAVMDGVREQGGTIFVHCNAGVSRSAAVTIAYVMQDQLISFQEAYRKLKELRPAIQPNVGFINQLKLYESELGV